MSDVEIQFTCQDASIPKAEQFVRWADGVLGKKCADAEVVIRIVDASEGAQLNEKYRKRTGPTNVLSFPFQAPAEIDSELIGDLVICAPVVEGEASRQKKSPEAHWAHMTVHGILHLLGYDHTNENNASIMEKEERAVLQELGFPNPYIEIES